MIIAKTDTISKPCQNQLEFFSNASSSAENSFKISLSAVKTLLCNQHGLTENVVLQVWGPTLKDGGSAGVSTAIAFLSLALKTAPPKLVATGTVDLLGNVGKIGGAVQKALEAARYEVLLVLPEENRADIEAMDENVKFHQICFIRHIKELLQLFPSVNDDDSKTMEIE